MSDSSDVISLEIHSDRRAYPVRIGPGVLEQELGTGRFGAMIVDHRFDRAFRGSGIPLITVDAAESNKSLSTCESVMTSMKAIGLRRSDSILAVGGGIIQDVATLSAALYLRGIEWAYAPTTVLSMVDSCIGGKSSINAGGVKNLVGNIYAPAAVVVDPTFADSLGRVDVASGLAEAVKISFCRGPQEFGRMVVALEGWRVGTNLTQVIGESLSAKKWFIEVDEHDKRERQLLNFGHTFGHALESASDFRIPHGIAVALGMRMAIEFSSVPDPESVKELQESCIDLTEEFLEVFRGTDPSIPRSRFFSAFSSDKKHRSGMFSLIVPHESGGVAKIEIPDSASSRDSIWDAVQRVLPGMTSDD